MSRIRGSSLKEQFHDDQQDSSVKSYKNGSNRYHFGMPRNEETSDNGRNQRERSHQDPDLLYKKSKQQFGAWDIKDIVQDESHRQRKPNDGFDEARLTNGRSRNDFTRQDRYEDDVLSRDDRNRTGSLDPEQTGSRRSKKKDGWETSDAKIASKQHSRSRNDCKDDCQRNDERDLLLREIENLTVDGRSPDRRIRAMIERFKCREEKKLKSRMDSSSPERDEHRSKSGEDERRSGRSRTREPNDKFDREESRSRSIDRRAENQRRGTEEGSKRKSYAYDGNPEDFDVRIQRYERAALEPRRVSLKDTDADLGRKDSFKDHDRQATRKSSFKSSEPRKSHSRDRESSSRKTSFKDQENDSYRKNASKDNEKKYFGKERVPERVSRKSSFKEQSRETGRKNSSKEQVSDYGRISSKNRGDCSKGHADGVSRITFKEQDAESRFEPCEEQDVRIDSKEVGRKNSLKEKTVEFAGISYKDHEEEASSFRGVDDSRRKHSPNGRYVEFGTVSYQSEGDETLNDRDCDLERRSSLKDSRRRSSPRRSKSHETTEKRSDRHRKPLTPPKPDDEESKDREEFDSKSWHESNRLFASKYLRENKYRANPDGRSEIEREPSPEIGRCSNEDDAQRREQRCGKLESYSFGDDRPRETDSRYSSTRAERNGATIIRIRTSPETSIERRRRRRPVQDAYVARRRRYEPEDEEESEEEEENRQRSSRDGFASGRAVPTPSRRIWNYREGGVLITDVEEGQPCLQCGETCSGFSPHPWRKNCTSCKCPREAHDVCHEEWVSVRSRLGLKGDESSSQTIFDPRAKGLAWAPPGLPAHKVEEYFSLLPEISVPRLGTPGERYRDRQLAIQLPKQDLARAYCRHLNPKHASSADDFMAARNEIALDIGSVLEVPEADFECGACHGPLKYYSLAVSASKLEFLYHPACFRCTECKELLVDLAYCVHEDTLYCERHYAEQLKPRCAACDEVSDSTNDSTNDSTSFTRRCVAER